MFKKTFAAIIVAWGLGLAGTADAALLSLTFIDTSNPNKGQEYVPGPGVTVTARGKVDKNYLDMYNVDAVSATEDDPFTGNPDASTIKLSGDGMGVQSAPDRDKNTGEIKYNGDGTMKGTGGSNGVSGKGGEGNEELIFTFNQSMAVTSILLGLNGLDLGLFDSNWDFASASDLPFLYLFVDRLDDYLVFDTAKIAPVLAYKDGDRNTKTGVLDFSDLVGLSSGLDASGTGALEMFVFDTISKFTLRNNKDEFYVTSLAGDVSVVPLPAALPLYGTGLAVMSLIGWRKRRKAAALA